MTPAAASSGPVFLICSERSGSNLLEQIVGAHPDVCTFQSIHHGTQLLRHFHYTLPAARSRVWRMLVNRAATQTTRMRTEAEARRLRTWVRARPQVTAPELAHFLYLDLAESAGRLLFIKERGLHHLMFFLLETFPGAKFVFQVRDPRDFLLSAYRVRGGWPRNLFGSTRQALAYWDQEQRFGLAALGLLGEKRVHLQRYEDLVGHPEATLRALTAFLDIKWDDGMLAFHETPAAQRRSRQLPVALGNLGQPLLRENFGKWRRGLSAGTVKIVEAHLGQLMDRFGYPRQKDVRHASWHRLKALLLAPIERVASRDLQLWQEERDLKRRLPRFDVEPLLPPIDYPTAP